MIKTVKRFHVNEVNKDFDSFEEAKTAEINAKLRVALCSALGLQGRSAITVQEVLDAVIRHEEDVRGVFKNLKLNKNVVLKAYRKTIPQETIAPSITPSIPRIEMSQMFSKKI